MIYGTHILFGIASMNSQQRMVPLFGEVIYRQQRA